MSILFICGYRLSGKSTFSRYLTKEINELSYTIYFRGDKNTPITRIPYLNKIMRNKHNEILSFASSLKHKYAQDNNISLQELNDNKHIHRNAIVALAKEIREKDEDYFVNDVMTKINNRLKTYIIDDWRYINELTRFYEERFSSIITMRIFNSQTPIPDINTSPEEHYLDNYLTDFVILTQDTTLEQFYKIFPKYKRCNMIKIPLL